MSSSPLDSPTSTAIRRTGLFDQFRRIYALGLLRNLRNRKLFAHFAIQSLPLLWILLQLLVSDTHSLPAKFLDDYTESLLLGLLLPLSALFYASPVIVEEVEQRTLTYLTLRPVARPILFFAKTAAAATTAFAVTAIPYLLLGIIAAIFSSLPPTDALLTVAKNLAVLAVGTVAYSSLFATIGTLFRSGILVSVITFVVLEKIVASLPVVDLLAVSTHLSWMVGDEKTSLFSSITNSLVSQYIQPSLPLSIALVTLLTAAYLTIGATVFQRRTYIV